MTLQELEQIKNRVVLEHAMDKKKQSPRVTVGMGTCGVKAGAGKVIEQISALLGNNTDVVVAPVGCIGLCSHEPVMEVAIPGHSVVMYGTMTADKVGEVVREHILGGKPVNKWVISVSEQ